MKPEIHECPKSHIDIEGNIDFTWAFKFDTTDNEVDGFSLLEKGELYKEWDKMIEETAYYVLSVGNFETKEYIPTFEDLCIQSFHALVTQPIKILG